MSHNSRTNLNHFQFRDYSYNLGRWLSPDPAGMAVASLADPQSFNRYSYVENQPVNFADNSGLLLTLGEEQGWCDVDGTCNFTFGWANGASNFDMTPGGDGCGSVSSLGQGACQLPPGLWPNGGPIMQSGVSIDIGGNLYGNMPGTNIPLSSVPLPWQINNNQECGDFAPCNSGISWIYGFTGPGGITTIQLIQEAFASFKSCLPSATEKATPGNMAENTNNLNSHNVGEQISGIASVVSGSLNDGIIACANKYPLAVLDSRFNYLPASKIFLPVWFDFPPIP